MFHFAIPQKEAQELHGESIGKVQSKSDHGKTSEVNAAGMLFLGAGGAHDDLQKTTTSSEDKSNNQDKVVMTEETVEEGKMIIPHKELMQWDHKEILGSGPWVPDCYNGKIQSFFAESGPFPDHFFNFSGLLVVIFIQIVKKGYKM